MLQRTNQDYVAEVAAVSPYRPGYRTDLPSIQAAILATVTYRDLFDYPTSAQEIHRYLQGFACTFSDVDEALRDAAFVDACLTTDGEYFALKGQDALFQLRRRRLTAAEPLWQEAHRYSSVLASLPFVRMVAVTGSLAVENTGDEADIDFMLITDGGRMWTVRALAKVLQKLYARFSTGRLCVNYLVSTRALELDQAGLYVAQEVAQMVPMFGHETYDALRAQNGWIEDYLPNAAAAVQLQQVAPRSAKLRWLLEKLLTSPLGRALESWESRRKIEKYNHTSFLLGRYTPFSREATGHRRTAKNSIEAAFADRLKRPRNQAGQLRILFGQGYHLQRDPKLYRSMQPFPPLGTLYAAGVARSLGHDVRVHDSMLAHNVYDWSASLQVNGPDVVVLYEDNFNYLTKMCLLEMRDAALQMTRMAKERDATVIVCSSDGADEPKRYLDAGADYILIGEGEETLADVLSMLSGTSAKIAEEIAGLAFKDGEGNVHETGRRAVIRGLDDLPMPAWDLIDLKRYANIWRCRHGRIAINMVTTRGCPYHCNWCAKPIWGQRYNARSPEHVVAELETLQEMTNVEYIWFMDDIFGLKPRWIERFSGLLKSRDLHIRFKCLSRADILLRDGEIAALANAGCDIVWLGAESGSQTVLDAMEKGTSVEMTHTASAALREHDVRIGLFIQFGYPGETRADIQKTIEMIRRIMPDELGISVSYPLPGTRFYDRVKSQLSNARHWRDSDDLAMLFRGPFSTAYYRALHQFVHSDLSMRKAFLLRRFPRKALATVYHAMRRTAAAAAMAFHAMLPHKGLTAIPAELDAKAASIPSKQPAD
jgi:radical SAM superfamily enzyme YgiQ (UPF0313 family)